MCIEARTCHEHELYTTLFAGSKRCANSNEQSQVKMTYSTVGPSRRETRASTPFPASGNHVMRVCNCSTGENCAMSLGIGA